MLKSSSSKINWTIKTGESKEDCSSWKSSFNIKALVWCGQQWSTWEDIICKKWCVWENPHRTRRAALHFIHALFILLLTAISGWQSRQGLNSTTISMRARMLHRDVCSGGTHHARTLRIQCGCCISLTNLIARPHVMTPFIIYLIIALSIYDRYFIGGLFIIHALNGSLYKRVHARVF